MYLAPELLEEIFLVLPLKSILKFKTVSKQWRSILESKRFAERRSRTINGQAKLKIMAAEAENRFQYGFQGDEEVEMLYLNCDLASRPSLSCDGLVCVPVPGWVNVFNPSTGEFVRFPSGPNPAKARHESGFLNPLFDVFPGYWRMGFGRDSVTRSYKIVRMCFNDNFEIRRCEILDVNNIGRWRKLNPPPYEVGFRRKSTCVNGSIYWVEVTPRYKLLALDLHTEHWRDVTIPLGALGTSCQIAKLENRLALAGTYIKDDHWKVRIWAMMNAPEEETWSMIYSIRLISFCNPDDAIFPLWFWIRPVAVSKQGNLFFHDNEHKLFKYYAATDEVRCLDGDIRVISPFVEDLFPLERLDSVSEVRTYGLQHLGRVPFFSQVSNFFRQIELKSPRSILVTTSVITLVMFRYCSFLSRS